MPYAAITARRMPFDIDGTAIGYGSTIANGITSWLSSQNKVDLNSAGDYSVTFNNTTKSYWFFFPEIREVTHLMIHLTARCDSLTIQGSTDSTNGLDGNWETPTYTWPGLNSNVDAWRDDIFAVAFSSSIKVLRIQISNNSLSTSTTIKGIHVYGMKAEGQTPDDVIFCTNAGVEIETLKDWGDTPEGSTYNGSFYLKNVSAKTANGINIQLNHADYLISLDQSNWTTVVDFTSLATGQVSAPIYVRKTLGPPSLILGPTQARAILTIASFT